MSETLPPEYFEDVYRRKADPWDFATSPYEAAKYRTTLAALPRPNYARAFEAGCSIGVLTSQLAARCERLLSVDVNEAALEQARERCRNLAGVRFELAQLPADFPVGPFDLIVVSEVGYYLSRTDLTTLRERCLNQLAPDGQLLLVHWTPPVPDYPLTGDQVHEEFLSCPGALRHLAGAREETYRLDLFERVVGAK